jgi:hypothetical protein
LQCTAADKKKDKLRSQLNCLKRKEARMEYEERKKERKKENDDSALFQKRNL